MLTEAGLRGGNLEQSAGSMRLKSEAIMSTMEFEEERKKLAKNMMASKPEKYQGEMIVLNNK